MQPSIKEDIKKEVLALAGQAHTLIENSYQDLRLVKGKEGRLEQKRFLLADLACHLLQDALNGNAVQPEQLKNHLYAILTLSDTFLPGQGLKHKADSLLQEKEADL